MSSEVTKDNPELYHTSPPTLSQQSNQSDGDDISVSNCLSNDDTANDDMHPIEWVVDVETLKSMKNAQFGQSLESEKFENKYKLSIYPNGSGLTDEDDEEMLSVFVKIFDSKHSNQSSSINCTTTTTITSSITNQPTEHSIEQPMDPHSNCPQ